MALEKLTIPDLGDSKDVEVIEILVSPGDEIQENDSLLVLETDKAAMEIPATAAGTVKDVLVKVGDTVNHGDPIVSLESSAGGSNAIAKEADSEEADSEEADSEEADSEEASTGDESAESGPEAGVQAETSAVAGGAQEAASGASPEASVQEITVPDLGTQDAVEIIEILVKVGDEVSADDGLLTLETDKAALDVPAPFSGKISDIKVKVGDKVKTGTVIMLAQTSAAAAPEAQKTAKTEKNTSTESGTTDPKPASTPSSSRQAQPQTSMQPSTTVKSQDDVYAGPAVRKLARELGVDLTRVSGSGIKGRIVKEDVHAFVKNVMQNGAGVPAAGGAFSLPVMQDIDFSQFGEIEEVETSKLHQVTARNMAQNWLMVPHVTQFEEADVTDLEDFRASLKQQAEKKGIKLSPLPFIVKACAQALAEFPQFNVSLHSSGTKLIQKRYFHIGVAVATPAGLMVPVVKDADRKSVWDIAAEIAELSEKAKARKLSREDMQGGCFTVSSLGNLGGIGFTPIVNAPEVAILGVSKTTVKPVWMDGEFKPRKILPFSLSYDHRAVNGVDGGMFCQYLNQLLSDIRHLVL